MNEEAEEFPQRWNARETARVRINNLANEDRERISKSPMIKWGECVSYGYDSFNVLLWIFIHNESHNKLR